jgi:hypothetical protein
LVALLVDLKLRVLGVIKEVFDAESAHRADANPSVEPGLDHRPVAKLEQAVA